MDVLPFSLLLGAACEAARLLASGISSSSSSSTATFLSQVALQHPMPVAACRHAPVRVAALQGGQLQVQSAPGGAVVPHLDAFVAANPAKQSTLGFCHHPEAPPAEPADTFAAAACWFGARSAAAACAVGGMRPLPGGEEGAEVLQLEAVAQMMRVAAEGGGAALSLAGLQAIAVPGNLGAWEEEAAAAAAVAASVASSRAGALTVAHASWGRLAKRPAHR